MNPMKEANKIIEMEVLNGIDKAFHSVITESPNNMAVYPANAYGCCETLAENLKNDIPKYIDRVFETVTSRLLK